MDVVSTRGVNEAAVVSRRHVEFQGANCRIRRFRTGHYYSHTNVRAT